MTEIYTFEDCKKLDDHAIQGLLKEVSREEFVMALKGAEDDLRQIFYRNISDKALEMIVSDLESLGKVSKQKVEKAQDQIVHLLHRLVEEEKVII